jgi:hypothetical protein
LVAKLSKHREAEGTIVIAIGKQPPIRRDARRWKLHDSHGSNGAKCPDGFAQLGSSTALFSASTFDSLGLSPSADFKNLRVSHASRRPLFVRASFVLAFAGMASPLP